ncbi:AMP-binding protein [Kribbella sp. CA-293567]|uniref:AMP-binding protein n=1 Tax=Kribbella sp. CA-293567 TaxID=3002436 RepID=UPI0022DDAC2E|nr:AMP-binding protein [Kribbella sp. CA-293567]WBQ08255.1 AMP-binding protein [Kribbella sp. CA-293567]
MNEDLVARFGRQVADDPSRPAVVEVGHRAGQPVATTATYGELDASARLIAGWLRANTAPGDRVLLLHPSPLAFAQAFWGCLYAGCVPVPAPLPGTYSHHLSLTTGIALDVDPRVVLTDTEHLDLVADWLIQDRLNELALYATDLINLSQVQPSEPVERAAAAPAVLQYTATATSLTGHSLSHQALAADVDRLDAALDLAAHGTVGGWLPMHHGLGLVGLLLAPLAVGATSVLMSPSAFLKDPVRWLRMLDDHDVRLTAAPNFAYDLCVRRVAAADVPALDLSRLRTALNGPEKVSEATISAFTEHFSPAGLDRRTLTPAYGPTDGVRLITVSPPGDRIDGPLLTVADRGGLENDVLQPAADGVPLVSCGPVEGTGLRIVDPATGRELADGLVGEIRLDDDVPTGDLGVIHDRQLLPTGPAVDRIRIDQRSLYAEDVERELARLDPRFADLPGCVCAVDVPREQLVVFQEVTPGMVAPELAPLGAAVREGLRDRFKVRVANVVFLRPGRIRRTAGRVQRTLMRELFCSDALDPVYEVLGRQTAQRYRLAAREAAAAGLGAATGPDPATAAAR